jgi:hypothetical protein
MNHLEHSTIHALDAVEAAAYRDMFAAAPAALRQRLGMETREMGGATLLIAPGLPTSMFNRVIAFGNAHPVTDGDLEAIRTVYREAGVRNWWIHLSPGPQLDVLITRLSSQGFTPPPRRAWVKVVRGTDPPGDVETPLDVRPIKPGEEQLLAETTCAAFEMPVALAPWFMALATRPHWQAVAAFDQDRVMGGGYLHIQGNSAWLGAGGVRPESRRQHAHRALMTLRIRLAIESGCTRISTETGEPANDEPNPSLRNMFACGFEKAASRLNFAAPLM